jgi:hypothetical protein
MFRFHFFFIASGVSDFLDKISGPTSVDRSVEKRLKAVKRYDVYYIAFKQY